MSMYELTQVLWRRKLLVGLIALGLFIVGGAAYLGAHRHATYTATSKVVVDQPGQLVGPSGAAVPSKLGAIMPTLCALLQGDSEAGAVAAASGASVSQARQVSCVPESNTLIVALSATTDNPQLSQHLSNGAAGELVSLVEHRYDVAGLPAADRVSASAFETAGVPSANTSPASRMLGIVAVGAILVAAAFTLAAEPHRRDYYERRSPAVLASAGLPDD